MFFASLSILMIPLKSVLDLPPPMPFAWTLPTVSGATCFRFSVTSNIWVPPVIVTSRASALAPLPARTLSTLYFALPPPMSAPDQNW